MKKIFFLLLILASTISTIAQDKQEVSIYLGAGYSSLKYNINQLGETGSKFVPLFGIGYTHKLNSQWGLVSGLEIAMYKSDISSSELKDKYITQDNYGNDFEWRLALHNLKESHTATYLNIPIILQFTPKSIDKLYANIGLKVGIPLSRKYEAEYTKLVTSGYYPETEAEYTDINFRGFGEFEGSSSKGNLDFSVAFILSAECGMKWTLSNSTNLYTGAYIDYGLNNIIKETSDLRIISYNKDTPTSFDYNSLIYSKQTEDDKSKSFIDKVVPFAVGLKFRLGFSL